MQTMHLFAGIGGGLLADKILGHDPIIAVEWDSYACRILRERATDGWFPNLQVWEGDVRLFDPSEYAGQVDCIHAGFPCQDISVAGKQAGVSEGTRSGLYREVLRIAGIVKPRQIFLENVSAILSNGLGTVLADLAAMGYDSRWLCIRASDVGAPHHRDRWFALCTNSNSNQRSASGMEQDAEADWRNDSSGICEILADTASIATRRLSVGEKQEYTRIGISGKNVADTERIRQQGSLEHEQSIGATQDRDREADWSINSGERNIGWWNIEPYVGRVANGASNRIHRLKGLGNAQVPLQAAVAWRLLGGQ